MFKRKLLAVAIASTVFPVANAQAQQSGSVTTAQTGDGSNVTITVTARRREELIQDVPAAVTAVSAEMLERFGVADVTGLAEMLPSTTLKTSRATNTTLTSFIRGVGQQDPVAGYEQGVGIYLDDVYMARPQGAIMDLYNVERIEVLRGPQGTLYGRNTIGGAVKYVTKGLSAKPEVEVRGSMGSFGQKDLVAIGSTPISDALRIGAAVGSFQRDGFGKNVVNGIDNYDKSVVAGRVNAELRPNSDWLVRFSSDRTVDHSNPRLGYRLTSGPAPTNEPVLSGNFDTRAGAYTSNGQKQEVVTHGDHLTVEWTVNPNLSFKSITADRGGESVAPIDFDSLQGVLMDAPSRYHDKQFSQEFQLTYTGSRFQGVAGLYYMKGNAFNEFDVALLGGAVAAYTRDDIDTKTWALYADGNYALSNAFNLSFGGRFTKDNRRAAIFKATYLGKASPAFGNPAATVAGAVNTNMSKDDLDRTDTKFTPKIGLGWKIDANHNAYATYSEGFKGGMFDPRMDLGGAPTSAASLVKRQGVLPEELSSFELGLKSRFAGGRVQTNAAVFASNYKNVQIPGSIPTLVNGVPGFAGALTNAAKADINGIELEGIAYLTDAFRMTAMYSYVDAKYKKWVDATGTDISASRVFQNTPKNTANVSATYEWPMSAFGRAGGLALTGSVAYKDKTYQFEDPTATILAQDPYSLVDASLAWISKDRKLRVGVYGRNLTDKRYKVAGYYFPKAFFASFGDSVTAFYGDPRTITATVDIKF